MNWVIERFTGGPAETHSYLVADRDAGLAIAVDAPPDTAASLLQRAESLGVRVERLVLTHAHFDHVLDAGIYAAADIPIAMHPADEVLLALPQTKFFGLDLEMPTITITEPLAEGGRVTVGALEFTVLETPGHAPGGICLHEPALHLLLVGDVLFDAGYGRVDLPFADRTALWRSLLRLAELPPETRVLSGHGAETTVGKELPWLARLKSLDPGAL